MKKVILFLAVITASMFSFAQSQGDWYIANASGGLTHTHVAKGEATKIMNNYNNGTTVDWNAALTCLQGYPSPKPADVNLAISTLTTYLPVTGDYGNTGQLGGPKFCCSTDRGTNNCFSYDCANCNCNWHDPLFWKPCADMYPH